MATGITDGKPAPSRNWPARLGWLCVYWAAGVAAVALAAWLLKLAMHAVGLSTP